ncbi:MAG: flagellar basal body P-ring formation chaperone FlgA [Legionellales bacterium]
MTTIQSICNKIAAHVPVQGSYLFGQGPKLIIAVFLTFAFSTAVMAETDSAIRSLQGDGLKTFITDYASAHTAHQDDESVESSVISFNQKIVLPSCVGDIDVSLSSPNRSNQANSVTLSCKDAPTWSVFIPVTIKILTQVLVASHPLTAGSVISAADVVYEKYDKNVLTNGFFKEKQAALGLVARYSINVGAVLTKNNMKQLPIIKKNQTITLAIKTAGIEVTMLGIAKSDGFLNETINVLNPSSKKIIDAIVISSTQAEINY